MACARHQFKVNRAARIGIARSLCQWPCTVAAQAARERCTVLAKLLASGQARVSAANSVPHKERVSNCAAQSSVMRTSPERSKRAAGGALRVREKGLSCELRAPRRACESLSLLQQQRRANALARLQVRYVLCVASASASASAVCCAACASGVRLSARLSVCLAVCARLGRLFGASSWLKRGRVRKPARS